MMSTTLILTGFISIGVVAWFVVESSLRKKHNAQLSVLEAKVRFAENQSQTYRLETQSLQKKVSQLQANLTHEKESQEIKIGEVHKTLRQKIINVGGICAFSGILLGGIISGFVTGAMIGSKHQEKMTGFQIAARVAETHAGYLKQQLVELEKEIRRLKVQITDERVEKAVALTKLHLIIESISDEKWGRKSFFDFQKLKKGLNESDEMKSIGSHSSMVSPHAMKV